jgi:hypothetical protein
MDLDRLSPRELFEYLSNLAHTDRSEDAPEHVVNRAVRIARQARPDVRAGPRLLGALRFDSFQAPLAFGVRSGASARHLLYEAGPYTIDVRLTGRTVAGQVLGPCTGGEVALDGLAGQADTLLSDTCEFELGPVPGGKYHLSFLLADDIVDIPDLELA